MIWLLALLAGPLGQWGAEARDRRRFPPPGRLVDVGDAVVHTVVEGNGPVVVIDSGLGGSSIEWARVVSALAPDFTVVTYDRPGFAWSPGSRCDRRAVAAAGRLIRLMEAHPGPAILVGHSLGGVHVRVAAALRPDLVRGLVLVDPSHENMLELAAASKAAAATSVVTRVASWLAPLGFGRLLGRAFGKLALGERRQPFAEGEADRARMSQLLSARTGHGLRALAAEHGCLNASLKQLVELADREPDVPLTVITAAAVSDDPRLVKAREQIDAMHVDLVHRRKGRQVLAERSGHLVPLDQPEIIVECVREMAAR